MRRGLSLIELLVVVAILTTLIGLLVPAAQRTREAAARIKCQSNLKQIGLALQDYISIQGFFPPAWANQPTSADDYIPGWGWGAIILPSLGQSALFGQLGIPAALFGGGNNPAWPDALTQTPIPAYRCPSDSGPALNDQRLSHALSKYRAVLGPGEGGVDFVTNADCGGVMMQNSRTRPTDVLDGTSTTVAIGECRYDAVHWAAIWAGMAGCDPASDSVMVSCVAWQIDAGASVIDGPAPEAFSSWHPGGAHFCFCDGSVRFFPDGGNVRTLMWLAGRNDGQVVNPGF
jgi:prepilin-type N-terminal cleavage/methylation domain-containing protein/prepilin-type processing-associated H-X9-DG protein